MLALELNCRKCRWRTVCGPADAEARLRLIGLLRRDKAPGEGMLAELLVDAAPRMTCPGCKAKGTLRAIATDTLPERDDWQAAVLCEICRQPIPPQRLEVLPGSKRCVDCQGQVETGTIADDEPDFCPKCGALIELRVSRGTGITRYKQFCTGSPPCRI